MRPGTGILVTLIVVAGVVTGFAMLQTPSPVKTAGRAAAPEAAPIVPANALPHRVIAYYFHTTVRCTSCRAIEAYSKEAIESAFAEEIKDGRLVWKLVNVESDGNEHFIKDFNLYSKSLVLVNEVRGKPAEWKNLEKIWQLVQDKPRFLRYVRDEMRSYLTESS